jgi:cobalt-zinc-cadmium efflux system protein
MAFAIGTILNLGFVIVEASYGLTTGSMALLADAGHNFGDVLSLIIAWWAALLVRRRPQGRFTYGFRGSSILAALFNATLLLLASGAIATEAIRRFFNPEPVSGMSIMIVAAIGILINGVTAWLFARGRHMDINVRAAFLHMVADAAVSAGVVAAGFLILRTGWTWIDPAMSLTIILVITVGTWGLFRESISMSLHAAPIGIHPADVSAYLNALEGVKAIHDLHIWPMSTMETALTVHILVPQGYPGDQFSMDIARELRQRFNIGHATIQIETDPATLCALEPDHVV